MSSVADPKHKALAAKFRNLLATYKSNQDLVMIGAYKSGSNPALDDAIRHIDKMNEFLRQDVEDHITFEDTIRLLEKCIE